MKKYFILPLIAFVLMFSSCDKYLDINYDPTVPTEDMLNQSQILPAVEMNLAASYGNYLRIVGGFLSEQYAQRYGTSNYLELSQFEVKPSATGSLGYEQFYLRVISSGSTVINKAKESNDNGTLLAATVLRAFAFAAMVDCYDSIPYTESVTDNKQPKYDDGRTVYNGIIAEIDDVLAKVKTSDLVATNFLFPGQNAEVWIRFANALKLKLYTRISNVDSDVLPKIAELLNSPLPTSDVAFKGCWNPSAGGENPFYAGEFGSNFSVQYNVVVNTTLIETMKNSGDKRIAAFFTKNNKDDYMGGVSGTNFSTFTDIYGSASFSRPVMTYDAPLSLLSLTEIEFYKAEYYARMGDAANAKLYYESAIRQSFKSAGVDGADENIAYYPYDQANWQKSIGLAKYLALSGVDNFEVWCELRRLRYPAFDENVSGANICQEASKVYSPEKYVPGTLYTPINVSSYIGNNALAERFPHPSVSSNANPNCPVNFDGIYKLPVFWVKK